MAIFPQLLSFYKEVSHIKIYVVILINLISKDKA